ncbi:transcription initiation factor TFIID component TAF4 family-domain-containing protein [Umbelopsis sp. PMI_123]|nr:transcription initiation factor TFIID component TAF4 family-domain-containing protein [Umbelopsis sp. PMI_123]
MTYAFSQLFPCPSLPTRNWAEERGKKKKGNTTDFTILLFPILLVTLYIPMSDKSGGTPLPTNIVDFDFSDIPSDIQSILDDTTFPPDAASNDGPHSIQSIAQGMMGQGEPMNINDLLGNHHHDPTIQTSPIGGNGNTTPSHTVESVNLSNMHSPVSDGNQTNGDNRLVSTPQNNIRTPTASPATPSTPIRIKHEDIAVSPHHSPSNLSPSRPEISVPVISTPRTNTPTMPVSGNTPDMSPADASAQVPSLLDNIRARLTPERRVRWEELFERLKAGQMTAEDFLAESRSLLGNQQYQQLQDLKNRPVQPQQQPQQQQPQQQQPPQQQPVRMQPQNVMPENADINGRKRGGFGSDNTPQTTQPKRFKSENVQQGMVMGPPSVTPTPYRSNTPISTPNIPGMQTPRPPGTPGRPPLANTGASSNATDERVDYDTLTDVMGYAGVDLKEEAEQSLSHGDSATGTMTDGIDRTKLQQFINMAMLKVVVGKIAGKSSIKDISPDFLSYLALATQNRVRGLVEQMVKASKHRVFSQTFDAPPLDETTGQPLYKIIVQQDIRKQLLAIERVEREEERRRKEAISDRERRVQQGEGGGGEDEDKPKKKKQKAMGPGVTARTMSEDMRNKKANETALMSAGGKRMSWMMSTADTPSPPSKSISSQPSTPSAMNEGSEPSPSTKTKGKRGRPRGSGMGGRSGSARDTANQGNVNLFLPPSTVTRPLRAGDASSRKVTVRDAIFALERERDEGIGSSGEERILLKVYTKLLK